MPLPLKINFSRKKLKSRLLLLSVSVIAPIILTAFVAIYFYNVTDYFQRWSEVGLLAGFLSGCVMAFCLLFQDFWWIAASFLFPATSIYGFWIILFFVTSQNSDWSLHEIKRLIFWSLAVTLAQNDVDTSICTTCASGAISFGLVGLLCSLTLAMLVAFIKHAKKNLY